MDEIRKDQFIADAVIDECGVHFLNRHIALPRRQAKVCQPRNYLVLERGSCRHRAGAELESNRTALHIDDGMVSICSLGSCCQSDDVLRFHLLHHLLQSKNPKIVCPPLKKSFLYLPT